MIENDQQLVLTKKWIAQFEESLEALEAVPQSTLHPKQRQAYQDATRSIPPRTSANKSTPTKPRSRPDSSTTI
jgi:hypothetical protein